MKHLWILAVALAACSGVETGSVPPSGGDACNASAHVGVIGQDAAAALALPEPKRIYRTDEAVTQDFMPERLNVILDETDTIIAVSCG